MHRYYKDIYRAKMQGEIVYRPLVRGKEHYPLSYFVEEDKPRNRTAEAFSSLFAAFSVKIRAYDRRNEQHYKPENMRGVKM